MDARERLIQLLTALVMDGFITENQAGDIVDAFDRGEGLPEGWALPASLVEIIPADLRDLVDDALLFYANIVAVSPDDVENEFIRQATSLARQLANGGVELEGWQQAMTALVIEYLAQQAQTGAQRAITGDDLENLMGVVLVQLVYLSRFGDAIASGRQSPAQVESRVQLYAGEGRALWYEQNGITNQGYGWVEDYIAVDDKYTCGPCAAAEAQGPYLPGVGPMPGRVCRGRGYCRCTRQGRYDPAAYLRITQQSA